MGKRLDKAVILLVLAVPLTFLMVNMLRIQMRMHHLEESDHVAILEACREAIAHRTEYRNDKEKWGGTLDHDDILVLAPMPPEIPEPLRDLHPKYLLMRGDHIIVNMNLPFSRIALIAFPEGQEEYGTFKYIDGLWFWNGNFEPEEIKYRIHRNSRAEGVTDSQREADRSSGR